VRRLIVIAARGLVVKIRASRPMPAGPIRRGAGRRRHPSFQLFDPRKRFLSARSGFGTRAVPRIHSFAFDPRIPLFRPALQPAADAVPPPKEVDVGARGLCRRLNALKLALDDLPRQAKRLARWRARQEKLQSPKFTSPLRPGRPPGYRGKPMLEVDEVLIECHGLAYDALLPDTS
jgi:hypothetical protein